jgi:hypothetical protein
MFNKSIRQNIAIYRIKHKAITPIFANLTRPKHESRKKFRIL